MQLTAADQVIRFHLAAFFFRPDLGFRKLPSYLSLLIRIKVSDLSEYRHDKIGYISVRAAESVLQSVGERLKIQFIADPARKTFIYNGLVDQADIAGQEETKFLKRPDPDLNALDQKGMFCLFYSTQINCHIFLTFPGLLPAFLLRI